MSNIKESYGDLVETLKALGAILGPATAVQYEAPPLSPRGKGSSVGGVRNPTLEIVMDPRRSAVSDGITAADTALRHARAILSPHIPALQLAVARWEGQEGPTQ